MKFLAFDPLNVAGKAKRPFVGEQRKTSAKRRETGKE